MIQRLTLILFTLAVCLIPPKVAGDEQTAEVATQDIIVVVGAAGTEEYGKMFAQWAERWKQAAENGECRFRLIGQDNGSEDLELLQQALAESVAAVTSEPLWLVLIGHGTFDNRTARFSLRGPDITATQLAELLQPTKRPVVVINTASCSAPFINALSRPDRVVVSATKDGSEIQFCRFGEFLSEAVTGLEADADRDGQTSLLEAWLFAARRTQDYYKSDGRLATEHALLDDSGDGKGSRADLFEGVRVRDNVKDPEAVDGQRARRLHVVRSSDERALTPEQRAERDRLEEQLEQLRKRRAAMSETDYLQALEVILIPLARIYESGDVQVRKLE